jgi:hypothetical protein
MRFARAQGHRKKEMSPFVSYATFLAGSMTAARTPEGEAVVEVSARCAGPLTAADRLATEGTSRVHREVSATTLDAGR